MYVKHNTTHVIAEIKTQKDKPEKQSQPTNQRNRRQ